MENNCLQTEITVFSMEYDFSMEIVFNPFATGHLP